MAGEYSEDKLIEQTSLHIFNEMLGWERILAYDQEDFGPHSLLGRSSRKDVLLHRYLNKWLRKLNPDLPETAYQSAVQKLEDYSSSKTVAEINFDKYSLLRDGIPVDYKNNKGEHIREHKLQLFDFENPASNDFMAVSQLWIEGNFGYTKRPDIVGFVNGVPLLFIELKAVHKKLENAFNRNLKDYKDTIPRLFHTNAFVIISNGLESKVGSITGKYQHFHEWKRITEEEEGIVSLDTILRGICDKKRFIDLFENFILYDTKTLGTVVKLIARNHQYIGVNKAIDNFIVKQEDYKLGRIDLEEKQKLGVFWHTQGSGKSYSMVFFCQKIHRKIPGNYTFVIATDRNELDKQIYGTFESIGAVIDDSTKATSGDNLKELLRSNSRYIFTLIHKFNFKDVCTLRNDVIVISDEAHRTQGGTLAVNMRASLPNASFIGFTGTPLFKDDEITRRIFGKYVSVYDFKRSIDDHATVPLYYENRGEKLKLDNPQITQQIRDVIQQQDELSPDQQAKLESLFAKEYPILTANSRLQYIARDIVEHFFKRGYKGKGMLVCIDKITAVKMYDFIMKAYRDFVSELEKQVPLFGGDQETLDKQRELHWIKETEICVVVSSEQNEIEKFRNWGLDITSHRQRMNERDLEAEFKDEENPFRLVIVCAMWITGFDVPSLSTLYLDKPMKGHTLMQTIARANRVHEGKNNGLIVDYIDTYLSLLDALAIYAVGEKGGATIKPEPPVRPFEELLHELETVINEIREYLLTELKYDLDVLVNSEQLHKIKAMQDGLEAINTNDETRKKFEVMARELFKKHKAIMPASIPNNLYNYRNAINKLYEALTDAETGADVSAIMKQIQDVVDKSVANMLQDTGLDRGTTIDLSRLNFDLIRKLFLKSPTKNTDLQNFKEVVEDKLQLMIQQNPLRIDFHERYSSIIDEYNRGKDRATVEKTFEALIDLVNSMSEEEQRVKREGLSEEQAAIFDLLLKSTLSTKEKNKVKEVAIELLTKLKEEPLKIEHWSEKATTSAEVRNVISIYLYQHLPDPYSEKEIETKTIQLFNHFKDAYFGGGRSVYA
jgi:type I restriction enzyme R subunit